MKSHHDRIRDALRLSDDGLTAWEIQQVTGISTATLSRSLRSCFGVYIDRWEGPKRGQYTAVWCVVEVPENTPKPNA